jgi:hypothetical protein
MGILQEALGECERHPAELGLLEYLKFTSDTSDICQSPTPSVRTLANSDCHPHHLI